MDPSTCLQPNVPITTDGVPYPFVGCELSELIHSAMEPTEALRYEIELNVVLGKGYERGGLTELARRQAHYVEKLANLAHQRQLAKRAMMRAELTGIAVKTAAGAIAGIAPAFFSSGHLLH